MKRSRGIPLLAPALTRRGRFAMAARKWTALTLTWRRAREITTRRSAHMARATVHNRWSPRFGLNIYLTSAVPALPKIFARRPRHAPPILWRQLQAAVTSFRSIARTLSTDRTHHQVDRIVRDVAAHERTIRTSRNGAALKLFRARPLPLRAISSDARLQVAARNTGRTRLCHASDTTVWTRHSQATSWTHRRSIRIRRSDHADLVFERSKSQRRLDPIRTPELVWRSEPQPYTPGAIERSISAATSSVAPLGAAGPVPFVQPPGPQGAPAAGMLDPALIDRVAENVIGRVERRIRIERERRGA